VDILDIKKIVKDLPEQEVRLYLQFILFKIGLLEDKEESLADFANDLKEMYNKILYPNTNQNQFDEGNHQKVHIQFGYPYLRQVLKELNLHKDEFIITCDENLAVGPIGKLDKESGQKTRYHWLKQNLYHTDEEFDEYFQNAQRSINQIKTIPQDVPIYIWISENANEQSGLLFTMYLLRERKNNIFIVDTGKLYRELFKKKAKKYVPFFSGEIISEELQDIYKYGQEIQRSLSDEDRTHFETQWLDLSENPGELRIWENGEIKVVVEDYYDDFIIEKAKKLIGKKKGFMKCARLVGEVYGHISQYIGDSFLEYRVRRLIEKGIFEYEGSLEAMRYYSIKFN